jgi:hypothetical protein
MNRLPSSRAASALVLTLLAVVLVTLAVLAFFTSITANRQVENSRAHSAQADQLVRTANDYVTGQFLQEIIAHSTAYTAANGPTIYAPLNNTNAAPLRVINASVAGDADYFSLVRQSISTADAKASGDSTGLAAANGPVIGTAQWNEPMLLTGGGFTGTTQLPDWIYVDRANGPTATATSNVVGRFAYNVYNIGGLLNANAAGYPSAVATAVTADTTQTLAGQLKTTLAGADLTQLGVGQSAVDSLISFRNPNVNTDSPGYLAMAQSSAATGFLNPMVTNSISPSTVYTNNYFNGRQDLLRYASTQNTPLAAAAPYLTTFSKSVNAPSWTPPALTGSTVDYAGNANSAASPNRFIPNVRVASAGSIAHWNDDGTPGTPTVVQAGDPLIQHRFSLAKLAWITHTGAATGISAAAIQACFGLVWNPSYTTVDGADPHWDYAGPTGDNVLSSIETLAQVASENREPNFFELLQAGILSGSLGKSGSSQPNYLAAEQNAQNGGPDTGDAYSGGSVMADETNTDVQLIRIGANIIDQARADNYPTAIEFSGVELWGIKDLPYFNKVLVYYYWPNKNPPPALPNPPAPQPAYNPPLYPPNPPTYFYYVYELWNPHQPTGIQGPKQFRVRINNDAEYKLAYRDFAGDGGWLVPPDASSFQASEVKNSPLNFTANNTSAEVQQNYRDPRVISTGTGTRTTMGGADALEITDNVNSPQTDQESNNASFFQSQMVFILEYSDDGVTYRPYATFDGHEENGGVISLGGPVLGDGPGMTTGSTDPSTSSIDSMGLGGYSKTDPRTFRFDCQWGGSTTADQSFRPTDTTYLSASYGQPWFMTVDTAPSLMAKLASNNSGNPFYNYADPDGIVRPGDAWYNDQNPYRAGDTVGGASSTRPIILDRPFRAVAELGYAYRDIPFKTLDLFTSISGDAGLLDLFSVNDEPAVVAGRVDLNTAQPLVRQSLLAGNPDLQSLGLSPATLASDYQTYAVNNGTPTANLPKTPAQLANFLYGTTSSSSNPGTAPANPTTLTSINLKTSREAAVRALGGPVQTRTWNLLIDVVAQTGRFTGASTTGADFVVEGERHCWLSIAIDRYTGKILDRQLEFINE